MKVTSPEMTTTDSVRKEDDLHKSGTMEENANYPQATAVANDAAKRKRSHEDEGDEENSKLTKKIDLKGDNK